MSAPVSYVGSGGAWHQVQAAYVGHGGAWVPQKLRLIGKDGLWVEAYSAEAAATNGLLDITGLSYRAGGPMQGALNVDGYGLSNVVTPEPEVGAFYSLRGVLGDVFENFPKMDVFGTELPIPADGVAAYALDGSKSQYLAPPATGDAPYDLLGLLGTGGAKHWEIGGKVKPTSWPASGVQEFVMFSGTATQSIAVYFDAAGTLYARFKNGTAYVKTLSIANAVSLNVWTGFVFRHRLDGATRYLELVTHTGASAVLAGDQSGLFSYWAPALAQAIQFGRGTQDGSLVDASAFFLASNTDSSYTISEGGLALSTTATSVYKGSQPSGVMSPNTGIYYLEILNRSSYNIHFGVGEPGADLSKAPGEVGWCVAALNGRKLNHQTGSGTTWTSAIAANSVIGLYYDSGAGTIEVFVNGVTRGKPFAAATIAVDVAFIIGGVSQTTSTNLFNPKVVIDPAAWTYAPTNGAKAMPLSKVMGSTTERYLTGQLRDVYLRNAPMASDLRTLAVIAPELTFELHFTNHASGAVTVANSNILKSTAQQLIIAVPDLPGGNYDITAVLPGIAASAPKFFSIVPFATRTDPLVIDFSSARPAEIRAALLAGHKQWGGTNGGISADNIKVDLQAGHAELTACGDAYTGRVLGVDRSGKPSGFNSRIGACLVTRDYFGPGRYRVVLRPVQVPGVCNAIWSFHYEEGYPGSDLWMSIVSDGLHQQGDDVNGYYITRNHEIDIEFPTALKTASNMEDVAFTNSRFNSWIGEMRNWNVSNPDVPQSDPMYSATPDPAYWSEYTDDFTAHGVNLADGNFHELGYDWHLGSDPRVEFYIDGVLRHTVRTHVPNIPGRFWIGMWFPSGATQWAGRGAPWDTMAMLVKSVSIVPFADDQAGTRGLMETYPNDIFRDIAHWNY